MHLWGMSVSFFVVKFKLNISSLEKLKIIVKFFKYMIIYLDVVSPRAIMTVYPPKTT